MKCADFLNCYRGLRHWFYYINGFILFNCFCFLKERKTTLSAPSSLHNRIRLSETFPLKLFQILRALMRFPERPWHSLRWLGTNWGTAAVTKDQEFGLVLSMTWKNQNERKRGIIGKEKVWKELRKGWMSVDCSENNFRTQCTLTERFVNEWNASFGLIHLLGGGGCWTSVRGC